MTRHLPPIVFALFALTATFAWPQGEESVLFLNGRLEMPEEAPASLRPLTCLRSALAFQGLEVDLATLRALSGEVWSPLFHLPASVREPLRDLEPIDSLSRGCEALGVAGQWHTGLSADEIMTIAIEQIGAQRPILAGFLHRPIDNLGWNLVIGVDRGSRQLMVHDVRLVRRQTVISLERLWTGSVPGPAAWVVTPLFTAEVLPDSAVPDAATRLRTSLSLWAEQAAVTQMAMPDHPGAGLFGRDDPAGLTAIAGPEAARRLAAEIVDLETLDSFSILWRVRTLVPQLAERRDTAAAFLRGLKGLAPEVALQCAEAAESLQTLAVTARVTAGLMWDQSLTNVTDAADFLDRVRLDPSLVIDLSGLPPHERTLLGETLDRWPQPWMMGMHSTPWGPALMVDSPAQRDRVSDLLEQLAEQMEEADARLAALRSL